MLIVRRKQTGEEWHGVSGVADSLEAVHDLYWGLITTLICNFLHLGPKLKALISDERHV